MLRNVHIFDLFFKIDTPSFALPVRWHSIYIYIFDCFGTFDFLTVLVVATKSMPYWNLFARELKKIEARRRWWKTKWNDVYRLDPWIAFLFNVSLFKHSFRSCVRAIVSSLIDFLLLPSSFFFSFFLSFSSISRHNFISFSSEPDPFPKCYTIRSR